MKRRKPGNTTTKRSQVPVNGKAGYSDSAPDFGNTPWIFMARLQFDIGLLDHSVNALDALLNEYGKAPDEELLERIASESVCLHSTLSKVKEGLRSTDEDGIVMIGRLFDGNGPESDKVRDILGRLEKAGVHGRGDVR